MTNKERNQLLRFLVDWRREVKGDDSEWARSVRKTISIFGEAVHGVYEGKEWDNQAETWK